MRDADVLVHVKCHISDIMYMSHTIYCIHLHINVSLTGWYVGKDSVQIHNLYLNGLKTEVTTPLLYT